MPLSKQDLVSGPQLAELSNEPYSTIDHWSDFGLLEFKYRGRRRLYERTANLERCRQIRTMQEQSMNLAAIKNALKAAS